MRKPATKKWNPFDAKLKDDLNWTQLKLRLNKKPRKARRIETGMGDIDKFFGGGLPIGLSVFYGKAGTGKSYLARTICKQFAKRGKKVLYFYGEDSFDAPKPDPKSGVNTVDMISYKMNPLKTLKTVLTFIQKMEPDIVVIDSLTTIFGETTKAIPEADIREYTGMLATKVSGHVPVIGISEVRGTGNWEKPAGGVGVEHAGLMLLYFAKHDVKNKWEAMDWGLNPADGIGNFVWSLHCIKDRDGSAEQGLKKLVTYLGDEAFLQPIVPFVPTHDDEEDDDDVI